VENFIKTYQLKRKHVCRNVINWFERNEDKLAKPGKIRNGGGLSTVAPKIKNSSDISISLNEAYKHEELAEALDELPRAIEQYLDSFPILKGSSFCIKEDINIQKYTPPDGGFHAEHTERQSLKASSRMLVWMIYLNTVEDGGGTEFIYYNKIEKAEEGKILIWPTDFTHTHRGIKSPTEPKYIMTGWYNFLV